MEVKGINAYAGLSNGTAVLNAAQTNKDNAKFSELLDSLMAKQAESEKITENYRTPSETLSSSQVVENGRLNGDYSSGFHGTFTSEADKSSLPRGAAANQANPNVKTKTIDRTSDLYEKALELESYFVKQMLSSMRNTIMKSNDDSFASGMYQDMLWDEYATAMTKNAGFGLADQIYNQLV